MLTTQILPIFAQFYTYTTPPLKTSYSLKTFTCNNIYSHKGTHFAIAPLIFLLIYSTPGAAPSTLITPTSTENIKIYSAITVSARVNIIYKQVTKITKDVQVIDCWLSRLKNSLSEVKDKLTFIRRGITILVYNARLLDIEFE